eukprot:scaffold2707_cov169-Amphora_coffeaeformis.AAC.12
MNTTPTVLAVYASVAKPNAAIFERRRIDTATEPASFVPEHGLVGSLFYHNNLKEHEGPVETTNKKVTTKEKDGSPTYPLDNPNRVYEERAILMQSLEHYEELASIATTAPFFAALTSTITNTSNHKIDPERVLSDPRFGEQIIVQGFHAKSTFVGDVLMFCRSDENGDEPTDATTISNDRLVVQVTSPRLACSRVDQKNGSPFGSRGVRRHVNTHGLGGWFVRVLQAGRIEDGMKVVKVRPQSNPDGGSSWTLAQVAQALYGECDTRHYHLNKPQWNRSKAELEDLCSIAPLGWLEWKAEAQKILDRWDDSFQSSMNSNTGSSLAIRIWGWFVWVFSSIGETNPSIFLVAVLAIGFCVLPIFPTATEGKLV